MLLSGKRLFAALISALLVCALLYWIDDDPPYPDRWHTVQEVAIITAILFFVFLGLSYVMRRRKGSH